MFRIHFTPRGGFWCVQFERFGMFWETVKVPKTGTNVNPGLEPLKFDTYEAADDYVVEKGIDQIYRCRSGEPPALQMTAQVQHIVQHDVPSRTSIRSVSPVSREKAEAQIS